jgi:demethylmenaquinone methyltransferase/2-methoxy-6-polyprenyl-1,4-benzoquinol methylase
LVDLPGLEQAYRLFSDYVIPPIGRVVTGDAQPYRYLVESIRKFPVPDQFSAMIAKAGFKRVTHTALTGNIAALHGAWKL